MVPLRSIKPENASEIEIKPRERCPFSIPSYLPNWNSIRKKFTAENKHLLMANRWASKGSKYIPIDNIMQNEKNETTLLRWVLFLFAEKPQTFNWIWKFFDNLIATEFSKGEKKRRSKIPHLDKVSIFTRGRGLCGVWKVRGAPAKGGR